MSPESAEASVGRRVNARVKRVEEFALYLEFDGGEVIVLIPDVADGPVDLVDAWRVGDTVEVRLWRYIEAQGLFKGTIREAALDTLEPRGSR